MTRNEIAATSGLGVSGEFVPSPRFLQTGHRFCLDTLIGNRMFHLDDLANGILPHSALHQYRFQVCIRRRNSSSDSTSNVKSNHRSSTARSVLLPINEVKSSGTATFNRRSRARRSRLLRSSIWTSFLASLSTLVT